MEIKRYKEEYTFSKNVWEEVVSYMDDKIREELHLELAPCTEEEFLAAYIKRDPAIIEILKNEFDIEVE